MGRWESSPLFLDRWLQSQRVEEVKEEVEVEVKGVEEVTVEVEVEMGAQVELAALWFFHWLKGHEGFPSAKSRGEESLESLGALGPIDQ